MRAPQIILLNLLTLVVSVGLSLLLSPSRDGSPEISHSSPSTAEAHTPSLRGTSSPPGPLRTDGGIARLDSLEREVTQIRAAMAPILETHKQLTAEALAIPETNGGAVASDRARDAIGNVARTLGLQAGRREALERKVSEIQAEVEKLERAAGEHDAKDGKLIVKIGAFPADAERLRRDWADWLERNLSREEMEQYKNKHLDAQLMGSRLSGMARRAELWEENGVLQFREFLLATDGSERLASRSVAPPEAREMLLEPYQHILNEK